MCNLPFEQCNDTLEFHVPSENMKRYLVDNFKIHEDKITVDVPIAKRVWMWNVSTDGILTIPDFVTELSNYMFYKRKDIQSVVIPNSVKSIGFDTFAECTELTSINIPNSVTSIECWAFKGCIGLSEIIIPNSITEIGKHTFKECIGLMSVTIPDSVISIGCGVFEGCAGLTSVTIPDSITRIKHDAFAGCNALQKIYVYSDRVKKLVVNNKISENKRKYINPKIVEVIHKPEEN